MFTGIIQELGTVVRATRSKGLLRLSIAAPKTALKVHRLESVSISGVCLSVVGVRGQVMSFDVIQETQHLTTLGRLRCYDRVNIEPSLSIADRFNGHFVFGHVDGMGTISRCRQLQGELVLGIKVGRQLRRFIVPKGPVALDGVSLTVGQQLGVSTFTVHLIPETLHQTTLGSYRPRDRVNIEVDYIAKLIYQFNFNKGHRRPSTG